VQRLIRCWNSLANDEAGQGLAEYGAIVAVIAIGALSLLRLLYFQVAGIFGGAATTIQTLMTHR
jgi:Flp pilus assembly pilin Flp